MVSKCANPGCPASFLYLHQGKLFRAEVEPGASEGLSPEVSRAHVRVEFHWLCEDCAVTLTLAYKRGSGVTVVPLARPPRPTVSPASARSAATAT